MRRCFGYLLMFFCIVLGYFIKLLQNSEDLSDFPTIKLYNINDFAMETAAISLTNAIKKRFQPDSPEIPLNNRTNSPVLQTYKSKFSKVSRNFLINSTQTAKTVLTLANNYLGNNRTNSQKTGNFSLFSLKLPKRAVLFLDISSQFLDFRGFSARNPRNYRGSGLKLAENAARSRDREPFPRLFSANLPGKPRQFREFLRNRAGSRQFADKSRNRRRFTCILQAFRRGDLQHFIAVFRIFLQKPAISYKTREIVQETRRMAQYFKRFDVQILESHGFSNNWTQICWEKLEKPATIAQFLRHVARIREKTFKTALFNNFSAKSGDSDRFSVRGDVFRLETSFSWEITQKKGSFSRNPRHKPLVLLRKWSVNLRKPWISARKPAFSQEWEHVSNVFAEEILRNEVIFFKNRAFSAK